MKKKLNTTVIISSLILLLSLDIFAQDLLRNQSPVSLYFLPNQIELGIDSIAWVELKVDVVENAFSAAGELVYEPSKIKILEVLEGNLLNQDGGQTTFLQNNNQANGRVYFGITRLGAQNGGVTSTEPKTVIKIRIKRIGNDYSTIYSENFDMLDLTGTSIGTFSNAILNIPDLVINQNSEIYFDPDNINLEISQNMWISLQIDSILGAFSCAGELLYDNSKIQVLEVTQGNFLNFDGSQTSFVHNINQSNGKVTFGITRLGSQTGGISTQQAKSIINLRIRRIAPGFTSMTTNNFGVMNNYGYSIGSFIDPLLLINSPQLNLNSKIFFQPDAVSLGLNDSCWVELKIDSVYNAFSFSSIINYDPLYIKIKAVEEGEFFNQDSVQTSFIFSNDTINGKLTIGITRLGSNNNGVSTFSPMNVFRVHFTRIQAGNTNIISENAGIVDNLGNMIKSFENQILNVSYPYSFNNPPTLYSPINGLINVPTSVTFRWLSTANAISYRIQVSKSPTFITFVVDQGAVTDTFYNITGLENNTKYYWRVNSTDDALSTTDWSVIWNFTTIIAPPSIPVLAQPANNSIDLSITPTLRWYKSINAQNYDLEISTDNNFTSLFQNYTNLSDTVRLLTSLEYSTKYYWRVRAKNIAGISNYSNVWSFTTRQAAPNPPALSLPPNGEVDLPYNVNLIWNSSPTATSYHLQVSTSPSFSSVVIDQPGLQTTNYQLTALKYSTWYYWRVRAANSTGPGGWSNTWSFKTQATPPYQPILVSPANNAQNVSIPSSLSWQRTGGEVSFNLEVDSDSNFLTPIVSITGLTNTSYSAQTLESNTEYFWRITSVNPAGTSSSNIWKFKTRAYPDLQVTQILIPAEAYSGQTFQVEWIITNAGNGGTTPSTWYDAVYWSTEPEFSTHTASLLGTAINISFLGPGESYSNSKTFNIGQGATGNRYIYVVADYYSNVPESNELNNTLRSTNPMYINLTPPPDLQVTSVITPVSAFSGQPINVDWEVKNFGTGPTLANYWTDAIYISSDSVFNAGTVTLLKNVVHNGNLAPNESYTSSTSVNLPQAIYGKYYIYVYTDITNRVFEYAAENNNTGRNDSLIITLAPPPDLVVTQIIIPAEVGSGQQITVDWTVENQGPGAPFENSWSDRIYISSFDNFVLDSCQTLGTFSRSGSLPPGSSYNQSRTVTVPNGLFGAKYIFVYTDVDNQVFEFNYEDNNVTRSPSSIDVKWFDLFPVSLTNPLTGSPGENIVIQYQVRNLGPASLINRSWVDGIYISTKSTFYPDSSILIGSFNQNRSLGVDSSYIIQQSVTIPNTASGSYYVYLFTDRTDQIFEHNNEGNNILQSQTQITIYTPDLIVSNIVTPSNGNSGQPVTIEWTVTNQGSGAILNRSWNDRVYISTKVPFTPDSSILLGSVTHSGTLIPASSYTKNVSFTLPNGIFGNYYIYVLTDYTNLIPESNENNNTGISSGTFNIQLSPWADLQVNSVVVPGSATAGQSISVLWVVQNYGAAATQDSIWRDNIYISSSPDWNENDAVLLKEFSINQVLNVGSYYQKVTSVVIPNNIAGNYYVFVYTDAGNNIFEYTAENNNIRGSNQINVGPYPPVDLAVTNLNVPGSANSGTTINIQFTITNQSAVATLLNSWTDAVYLSSDNILNQSTDILLSTVPRTGILGAGASYTRNLNVSIPNGIEGQYYIITVTDKDNLNNDSNLLNNVSNTVISITLTPSPDLIITSLTAPQLLNVGQPVVLSWQVNNSGVGPTVGGLWYDKIYISQDTVIDNTDFVIGNVIRNGDLNAGEQYSVVDRSFNTPSNLSEGEYYIIIKTDSRNDIYEHNAEDNNTAYSQINIFVPPPADLIVENIIIPDTAISGELVEVSWTLKNIGVNPAIGWIDDAVYFSTDSVWSIEDKILGISKRYVNISSGGALRMTQIIDVSKTLEVDESGNLSNIMPGLRNGNYFVIVRTNIRNAIYESDITNNKALSENQTFVDVPTLNLGELYTTTLNQDQRKYFKVEVPEDQDLRFLLSSDNSLSVNEIYCAYNRTPDVSDYDYASFEPFKSNQEVLVPETNSGTYYVLIVGRSVPGNNQIISIFSEALGFTILSISPPYGGTGGKVTTTIRGAGLADSLFFYLRSTFLDTVCIGKVVERISRSEVSVKWDLRDVPLGIYDVCLTKNDIVFTSISQVFEVQQKITNQLLSTVISPREIIRGRDASYQLFVTNSNNINVDVVVLSVLVPANQRVTIETSDFWGRPIPQEYLDSLSNPSAGYTFGDYGIITAYAKNVKPGQNLFASINFSNVNPSGTEFPIIVDVVGFTQEQFVLREGLYLSLLADTILNAPLGTFDVELVQFFENDTTFNLFVNGLFDLGLIGDKPINSPTLPLKYFPGVNQSILLALTCDNIVSGLGILIGAAAVAASAPTLIKAKLTTVFVIHGASVVLSGIALVCEVANAPSFCETLATLGAIGSLSFATVAEWIKQGLSPTMIWGGIGAAIDLSSSWLCDNVFTIRSYDPNDILGPKGFGEDNWIAQSSVIIYSVRFENDSTLATGPAQIVNIVQKLDTTLDARSFRLGSFGFGDFIFNVPQNTSFYSNRLDLRNSLGFFVDVIAGIDVTTNNLFWTLRTIDPATGQIPLNPLIGFLPINDTTHAGEGFVNYTIYPNNTLQSGDVITAKASIIFDNNDPIETPIYTNTIDAGKPVSRIHQLPVSVDSTDIWVTWSGEDDSLGSGIAGFTIYVSENDSNYYAWISNTRDTAAIFNGIDGYNYKFFSIAADNVGNTENWKNISDAEVTLGDAAIQLRSSWNLISWNKQTENDSIRVVFANILDNLIVALGFDSVGLTFDPEIEDIYNNLLTVNNKSGYWLKMEAEDYLLFTGERIDAQTPIYLRSGWNLISYLPAYSDSVRHALESILDKVIIVQAFDGNALTFHPLIDDSINTLKIMSPNYGYWVKMSAADTLIYSTPPYQNRYMSTKLAKVNNLPAPDSLIKPTNEWISVYATEITIGGIPIPFGTEITFKDPSGIICGKGVVIKPGTIPMIPVFRDDITTPDIDEGAEPGDQIRFFINDALIPIEIYWIANGHIINISDLVVDLDIFEEIIPKTFDMSQNYPNPFNPITTIKYQVPQDEKVNIEVYNILGQRVKTLVNEIKEPGYYEVKWNSFNDNDNQVASGVYIYRMRAGEFEKSKKMIILK